MRKTIIHKWCHRNFLSTCLEHNRSQARMTIRENNSNPTKSLYYFFPQVKLYSYANANIFPSFKYAHSHNIILVISCLQHVCAWHGSLCNLKALTGHIFFTMLENSPCLARVIMLVLLITQHGSINREWINKSWDILFQINRDTFYYMYKDIFVPF